MISVTDFAGRVRSLPPITVDLWLAANQSGIPTSLSRGVVPDPYSANVAYRKEPRIGSTGKRAEIWRPWWDVQTAGWGDCEDLSCWLAAWLRQRGDTSAYIGLIEFPAGGWHAVTVTRRAPLHSAPGVYRAEEVGSRYPGATIVCRPDASPAGWWVYDVSYAHGMRDPSQGATYAPGLRVGEAEPLDDDYRPYVDPYYSAGLEGVGGLREIVQDVPGWAWVAGLVGGVALLTGSVSSGGAITPEYLRGLPWASIWIPRWGYDAAVRLVQISRELGMRSPVGLLAVIYHETGGSFDPAISNAGSGATGLIQFMPSTARRLGTTVELLRRMTALQQLEYVRSYLLPGAPYADASDVYDFVFMPGRVRRSSGILAERGETDKSGRLLRYYEGNRHLDVDGDGYIRRGEPATVALADLARSGYSVGAVRSDDPSSVQAFRRNTSASTAMSLLGQAAGKTQDRGLLLAITRQIRFLAALPPASDVSEHSSMIIQLLRQAEGLQGSASADPGWRDTVESMADATRHTARTLRAEAGRALEQAAAAAESGIASSAQATGTLLGVPGWVWILGAGGLLWWKYGGSHDV